MDTGFRHDLVEALQAMPVAAAMGFTFTELADGRAVARLPWRAEHSHTPGAFQAGPITSLADFVGGAAVCTRLPTGGRAVTTDITVKFLAEARGDVLVARARALRTGRRTSVGAVDLTVDERDELCATVLLTMTNHVGQA